MECVADKVINAIVKCNKSQYGVERELDLNKLVDQFVKFEHSVKMMRINLSRDSIDVEKVRHMFSYVMVELIKMNGILYNSDKRMWLEVCDYMDNLTAYESSVETAMCNDVFHNTKLKLDVEIGEFEQ